MRQKFLLRAALSLFVITSLSGFEKTFAQSEKDDQKKTSIRIKVTEDKDGKSRTVEKNYELPDMPGPERENFVDKAIDSMKLDPNGKKQVTITVDDGNGNKLVQRRGKMQKKSKDDHEEFAFNFRNDDFKDLNFNFDELRNQTRNLEREIRPKAKIMIRDMEDFGNRMGDRASSFWNNEVAKSSTVRELNVYPNNPDNGVMNLRFYVPQKGDVFVTISDTKGKEVGKKEIKDFSGEFVGQIDIKKNTKGTLFVTVTQNEDGAVKRVVLP
ncbi:T9SS type A sorting domain-containing protein [Dyadobacter sp. CY356]|uniref:T9SS type A sorting domain-containing protein n=1 Tax=Dyadobacter sp. CY356 TaxID=2906442 RepID=UPI001F21C988|nr:T9SS type A sorting domain-containing protein [Dyadobacter sp. CY356]MCF0056571.1 T9SS type A sorting domain-containing protein [Dyadobacter sp. CY356]